jgi:tetratricopeptide (TPR) repeat protein
MIDVIICPHCQRKLALPPQHRDCDVLCPGCNNMFHVGADAAAPSPPALPPVVTLASEPPRAPERRAAEPPRRRPSIARRPATPARKSAWRSRGVVAVLLIGVFSLVLGGLVPVIRQWQSRLDNGGFKLGVDLGGPQLGADAFDIAPGVAEPEVARDLEPLFRGLQHAFRAGEGFLIVQQFDTERSIERLVEQQIIALPPVPVLVGAAQAQAEALRRDLEIGFRMWAPQLAWNSAEILHIKKLNDTDFAVIVSHRATANNMINRVRWYVTRRPGMWRVYDMEDLGLGMFFSALTGIAAAGNEVPELQRLRMPIERLREAQQAVVLRADADTADRKLQEVAALELPPPLNAIRWGVTSLVHMQRNQPQEVLAAVAKARTFNKDMPVLDLFEGIGHNRANQYARALPLLKGHIDLLGNDWETNRELGDALLGLGRTDQARSAYRKTLDDNPKETHAFVGLLHTIGPDDVCDDLGPRFLRLDNLSQQFETMSEDCRQARDGRSLEQLAAAMRGFDPAYAPAHFALAMAKAWAEQADDAVGAFQAGLNAEPDAGKRRGQTTLFLQAMAASGLARRAYEVAPDRREAFQTMAAELNKAYRKDELRLLVAAHAQRDPGDWLLSLYQAELLVDRGKYAQADKLFAAAARGMDARTLDLFRPSRVQACYHTGKAMAAYATIGPARQTFQQLAMLAEQSRNDALLTELFDAHGKADPEDPELFRHRVRLQLKQGNVDAAVALFRETLNRKVAAQAAAKNDTLVGDFLHAMAFAGKALEAYAAAPEPCEAFERLAQTLRNQAQHAELRQLMEVHRKQHGDDLWVDVYTGALHLKEQQWTDAARVLAGVWQKAPDPMRERIRFDTTHALYKAGRARDAYRQIEPHAQTFQQLAGWLIADKNGAELQALIDAHRPNAGDDAELAFIEARARLLQKRPAEALKLWQDACKRQPNAFRRRDMIRHFVLDMHAVKQGVDAYHAAPDRLAAFEALAQKLVLEKNAAELGKLVAEHGKDHSAHTWWQFYRGEHMLLIGEADLAQKLFATALAGAAPSQRWTFRNGLYRAQVRAGQVVQAYKAAGNALQPFRDMASVCQQEKNAAQLKALVAAHRAVDPDDPNLLSWELEAVWLSGDHAGTLALLAKHTDEFTNQLALRYKGDNYRVRALVKLKRTDEAIREAEALQKTNRGSRTLVLLAYAAAGDVKSALAVMERLPPQPYLVHDGYADPDLGPLVRGDAMRAFRERYPEPPQSGVVVDDDDDW